MHKISVPISLSMINEETLPVYLGHLQKCKADRVFLCGMGNTYMKTGRNYTDPESVRRAVSYFKSRGFEVGIWIPSFGNGHPLDPTEAVTDEDARYTQITGIRGEARESLSCCPLDENFVKAYCEGIKSVASFGPDLIMLDDDFRFNDRIGIGFACFCPLHMKEYRKRIGEEIPRDELEKRILTGGRNKYRTELLKLFGDSLLGFAKKLRAAVDEVDPSVRLGACTHQTWDMHGTDPVEIAKAFAGKTRPFARISGAPFRNANVIPIIEYARQQCAWGRGSGVELFSEGDTYPRPRTVIPSKPLELFDLVLSADGCTDGILAYLECYDNGPRFEEGYAERFARNAPLREKIFEMFGGKKAVGVEVFAVPHKAEDWLLPDRLEAGTKDMLLFAPEAPSRDLLSANSIPTSFEQSGEYPLFVMGENARHLDLAKLKRGAILDAAAAKILGSRGVDTGLLSIDGKTDADEKFLFSGEIIRNTRRAKKLILSCKEGAEILSRFVPGETPASYRYENSLGQRFYVMAFDLFRSWKNNLENNVLPVMRRPGFEFNYCRQAHLASAVEWISGKRLPAMTFRHPNLYLLAKKDRDSMAVALANVHLDDVFAPVIRLDRAYREIRFLNCSGMLEGDRVTLSDIPPYGFAAFEVK